MCGIIAIYATQPVNQLLYEGLLVLQHRGQDAAGIVTYDNQRLYLRKKTGLVRDVFWARHMMRLRGNQGIGHVRYPTAGGGGTAEAQPFYVNSPFGIALSHNGNLTNTVELQKDVFHTDRRHINTGSDSEVLLNVFADELHECKKLVLEPDDIFAAVSGVHRRCRGAYSAVGLLIGHGIFAFRDPYGIRPLVFGSRETANGIEYMVASESVALDTLGFTLIRDVAPGEALYIDMERRLYTRQCAEKTLLSPCIFEHVYFARPDSIMDRVLVYEARIQMGKHLAAKMMQIYPNPDIDVVIPIPDTSRTAALEVANRLGVPYREGFVKNRYIGRTFIMPGQKLRKRSVRQKLNPIAFEFRGKSVLLIDDSIVRGTTSREIVQMARESGARKVFLASAAPPVRFPNVYGIDMPTRSELIAYGHETEAIARDLGLDGLIYQDIEDLTAAVRACNPELRNFDTSCFTGEYITGDITPAYLDQLEKLRDDKIKERQADVEDLEVMGLYNDSQ